MAEREGFEPPLRLRVKLISSQPHSTTLPPLRVEHVVFGFFIKSNPWVRIQPFQQLPLCGNTKWRRGWRWSFSFWRTTGSNTLGACRPSQTREPVGSNPTFSTAATLWKHKVAERVGFEPTRPCGLPAFQASSFNHSDTSPTTNQHNFGGEDGSDRSPFRDRWFQVALGVGDPSQKREP